ncbi:P-loop NTPase family protein [Chachezhania sediminis]|uniref:chromosomal replication initiator DnaA n=1 Tax=Chachezhania sediminis TaxID=2599291 RepID=UPI00131C8C68|nr:chromosomal replication initiator DnaA [Chachezhania sediminis]
MTEQLRFDLPVRTALGREDFFVSPANAIALAALDGVWPGEKMVLTGPAGAGKTHLAHVWAGESGARLIPAMDLAKQDLPDLAQGPIAVEDVPRIAGRRDDETALFHLHNMVLGNGHRLLMTGRLVPRRWALSLPDLQSRCEGATSVALDTPDDALLGAVMIKMFADRGIRPKDGVILYLVRHMERSFAAAARVVDRLDHMSMDRGRDVNRQLAIELLREDQA